MFSVIGVKAEILGLSGRGAGGGIFAPMPSIRQAVLAARDLESTVARLRDDFDLGEPYRDPGVAYFGLANAVFAIGDTFLEVISPVDLQAPGARTAARQLERAGAPVCGYMALVQIEDLAAARGRARAAGVREVFDVELDDIAEVHLHPRDMGGAIVALSVPRPAGSWRWGGEGWNARAVPGRVTGITVAVNDPDAVSSRWASIAGGAVEGCTFVREADVGGIVEIGLQLGGTERLCRPDSY